MEREVKKYRSTKNELWLYQASEKTWTAYVLAMELLAGKELKSRKAVDKESWKLIKYSLIPEEVYKDANMLHVYHYEGRVSIKFILKGIVSVKREIRRNIAS